LIAYPAVLVSLWLLRHELSPWVRLLFIGALALSAFRAQRAIASFTTEREQIRQQLGASARCSGQGEIVESPILRQGKFVLVVRTSQFECGSVFDKPPLVRIVGGPDGLARGDEITFVAQLGPVAPLRQIELSDPIPRAASKGIVVTGGALAVERIARRRTLFNTIDRARAHVRQRIVTTYAPKAEALGRALVLGENDLEVEDQLAFQKSGLSHLLAVSGTHLVFAVASLVSGLRALLLRVRCLAIRIDVRRIATPIGALLALAYADFAGGSGSAFRAAFMLTAVYVATGIGRPLRGLAALAYSMLVGAIIDPLVGYDISFLLSAGATAGLIVIGPGLARPLEALRFVPLRFFLMALATTTSAMIPCVPLLLLLSPEITLAGLVANVLAGPIGEMGALPLCLLHTIAAPLRWLESGLALAGSGALLSVAFIAKVSSSLTFAQVPLPPPSPAQFVCLGVTVLGLVTNRGIAFELSWCGRWSITSRSVLLSIGTLAFLGLEWAARMAGAPMGTLRITAVDVGQGDALLVDLPDGRLMLVDGGGAVTGGPDPGRFILAPLLRARRRKRIDIVVLTHPHPDHFGGLLTLLPQLPIGEFWEAGENLAAPQGGELATLRDTLRRQGTRLRKLDELCERPRRFAGAVVEVLGPCPDVDRSHSANDQSIVLRFVIGKRVALLPGDAEVLEEGELVDRYGLGLRADFLKLGHHGSKSSTSERWLYTVKPGIAVVSVGLRNRFGHPHVTTLDRLRLAHVPVYRTDELGSIQWSTDGDKVTVNLATHKILTKY
jgi:competence protein ComEC